MLTVIAGPNTERQAAALKAVEAETKKGKQLVSFSDASFKKESVMSYAGGADMFGLTYVVHLSRVSENAAGLDFFLNDADGLSALAESPTVFVAEESELSKELKKVFDDAGARVTELKAAKAASNFFGSLTPFSLVDAYNERDKKRSWVLFTELIGAGGSAEEIAGAMIWNFKNLALYHSAAGSGASSRPTAASLGMKPFVFSKVSAAAQKFSSDEVRRKSYELSAALHDSHRGKGDGATLLELFILKSL